MENKIEQKMQERISRFRKIAPEFYRMFDVRLDKFCPNALETVLFGFDIIKFDEWLKEKHGDYEDGKTSMSLFIKKEYGSKAMEIIKQLIQ